MTEAIDLVDQQIAPAIRENDRKKENASFDLGSKVSRHSVLYHDHGGHGASAPFPTLRFVASSLRMGWISRALAYN
jgi:hypothetical protein